MKLPIAIALSLASYSCVSVGGKAPTASVSPQEISNNAISVTGSSSAASAPEKEDEIIFEGSNNLFELVEMQAAYFDDARDVIIIRGNGNIIRLYNTAVLDLNSNRPDTLVLVGNKVKYLMCMAGEPKFKKSPQSIDTVQMQPEPLVAEAFLRDLEEDQSYTYTIKGLLERIAAGEDEAYFELAEMYKYGIEGTPISTEKAIELYEWGAVRGDKMSIRRLGDLWTNGTFDKAADKTKGRYYYQLGAQLGDGYCREMLAGK